jgi:hypothetical protein
MRNVFIIGTCLQAFHFGENFPDNEIFFVIFEFFSSVFCIGSAAASQAFVSAENCGNQVSVELNISVFFFLKCVIILIGTGSVVSLHYLQ